MMADNKTYIIISLEKIKPLPEFDNPLFIRVISTDNYYFYKLNISNPEKWGRLNEMIHYLIINNNEGRLNWLFEKYPDKYVEERLNIINNNLSCDIDIEKDFSLVDYKWMDLDTGMEEDLKVNKITKSNQIVNIKDSFNNS